MPSKRPDELTTRNALITTKPVGTGSVRRRMVQWKAGTRTRPWICFSAFIAIALLLVACLAAQNASTPYGLNSRIKSKAYLQLPPRKNGVFPPLLSQTGAFRDTRNLIPSESLIPYDVIVPFWSDGANKSRWIAVPKEKIAFAATGEWKFPRGTVFVKNFELSTDETDPGVKRRLETRFLVCDSAGGVYGVTYKWRADNSDADLLSTSLMETIPIKTATGERTQTWYYPSREDCKTCHTANAGGVLGVKTRQMNRDFTYPSGVRDNELRAWNHAGLFSSRFRESDLPTFAKLAQGGDPTRSLEDRARSYLDVNCAQCHRPEGTVAYFDARYDTPLAKQELIEGPVLLDQGIDRPRVVVPNDIWRSILFMRVNSVDTFEMPPLAHETVDKESVALLRQWIQSMPGQPVLDPPTIAPGGGNYDNAVDVILGENEAGAEIRYTLDGSAPTASDLLYEKPIKLTNPTVVRARAFKPGFTRSIITQGVFIIGG
jgi:uncharacterized repeat protein (TIGR03806 family)